MQKNGWNLFQFRPFAQRLKALTQDVSSLAQRDPDGYKQHPKTKLLASVYRSISETVPANPADPVFRLGHTLGRHFLWFLLLRRKGIVGSQSGADDLAQGAGEDENVFNWMKYDVSTTLHANTWHFRPN